MSDHLKAITPFLSSGVRTASAFPNSFNALLVSLLSILIAMPLNCAVVKGMTSWSVSYHAIHFCFKTVSVAV